MFINNTLLFASMALFGISNGLFAQDESKKVSEEDLETFVVIYKEVQTENKKIQQKMVGTIQAEGMDINRYNEINQANANPETEVDATDEELKAFEKVTKKVKKIQKDFQAEVKEMIESEGMSLKEYQEVYAALQKDKSLQEKFGELMNG
jgi:uncharacterized protein YhaN